MQKTLVLLTFFITACYSNSSSALQQTLDLELLLNHLHTATTLCHQSQRIYSPLPTRATGAQAIGGFGAIVHKVGLMLPPPQAAILEAMSLAINFVAECVDADEKKQEYLDFLRWKEGQQKSIFFIGSSSNTADLSYAISAVTRFYEELFKPQRQQIIHRIHSLLPKNEQTVTNNNPQIPNVENFFDNLAILFAQGIKILKQIPSKSSF